MKDKLMKNLGLKILSLLIAAIIWVIIVNLDDPVITRKFSDITVTPKNVEAITDIGKVYTIIDGGTVDIYVTGRRQYVNKLTRSDLSADADLSALSQVGATYIEPHINKLTASSCTVELGSTKMMKVQLEDKDIVKKQIEIRLSGEVDSDYTVVNKEAKPNMISISGAKSVVNKIDSVYADINLSGYSSDFHQIVLKKDLKVYDFNKDLIRNDKLEFSQDEVKVSITVQKTKEIELRVIPVGEPKPGYELVEFESLPKTILVTGTDDVLNHLSYITIEYEINDLYENDDINENDDVYEDFEANIANYDKFIDALEEKQVTLVDETQTIALSARFEKLENKEVTIEKSEIEVKGVPEGFQAEINTDRIQALVQGRAGIIKHMSASDLKPYIELSGQLEGTKLISIKFEEMTDYQLINQPIVNVTIRKIVASDEGSREEE